MKAQTEPNINLLIRLEADEEMTIDQHREWDAYLAQLGEADRQSAMKAVDFERQLRKAVAQCMRADGTVPIDLPIRITKSAPSIQSENDHKHHHVDRRWFVPSGLAAGILLIISVSLIIGILGNRTDQGSGGPQLETGYSDSTWAFPTIRSTQDFLNSALDTDKPTLPLFDEFDYRFVGANPVTQDGRHYGVMVVYVKNDSTARLRLWIQPTEVFSSLFSTDDAQTIQEQQAYKIIPPVKSHKATLARQFESQNLAGSCAWIQGSTFYCLHLEGVNTEKPQSELIELARHAHMPDSPIIEIHLTF